MTRTFSMAIALALSAYLAGYSERVLAQQTEEQPADTSADANQSDQTSANASAESDSQSSGTSTSTDTTATPDADSSEATSSASDQQQRDTATGSDTQSAPSALPPPADDANAPAQPQTTQGAPAANQPSPQGQDANVSRESSDRDYGRQRDDRSFDRSRDDRSRDIRRGVRFGRGTDRGLRIDTVERNSFLFRGGFRDGDVIISVNRRPVRSEDEFYDYVHTHRGQRAPIVVLRDGREETLYLSEEQSLLPADQQVRHAPSDAGARPYFGVVFDPRVRDGAVIQAVQPNSPAEAAGLKAGDELVAINGEQLYSYRDAIDIIRSTRPGDTIDIDFSRRLDSQTQAVIDSAPGAPLRTATNPAEERVESDMAPAPDERGRSLELRRGEVDRDEEYRDRPRESDDDQRLFNRGLLRGRRN